MANTYLQIATTGKMTGTVVNTIIAEPDDYFDPNFKWQLVEPNTPTPGIGAEISIEKIEVITGKADTFDSYMLSPVSGGFTVSYDGLNVNIDCRSFDMKWLRAELTDLCKNGLNKGSLTVAGKSGVLFEEYCISWDDSNTLLTILETLK